MVMRYIIAGVGARALEAPIDHQASNLDADIGERPKMVALGCRPVGVDTYESEFATAGARLPARECRKGINICGRGLYTVERGN